QGLFMKTWEAGLAYNNGVVGRPSIGQLEYYADRSPDIPALIQFVNSIARGVDGSEDDKILDYALSQTFSFSRAKLSPGQRGQLLAIDIRDGTQPERMRPFSEKILELRKEPGLPSELKHAAFNSICGVLLMEECQQQQEKARSIFFFVGSDKTLNDVEKRLFL